MVSFCKSCQENNVNTRIEWRPNPDKPGKNKPFDIDKNEWHICPYWKKTFNNFKQTAAMVEKEVVGPKKGPTTQQGLVEEQVNQAIKIETMQEELRRIKVTLNDLSKAVANISNFRASDLKASDQQED